MFCKNKSKSILFSFSLLLFAQNIFAQSPPNNNLDVTWDSDPVTAGAQSSATTIVAIQNAFNNGRRQEEIQKSLTTNSLGNLTLASNFLTLSKSQKIITLINLERACRAGIDYDGAGGIPPVLGLTLDGLDPTLTTVAQNHADWLQTNNLFQHTGSGGSSPFTRIQNAYALNTCSEFLAGAENIYSAYSSSATITGTAEKAVYNWIYKDSGSNWMHREATLLQNIDLSSNVNSGYKNNFGTNTAEGMIGYGFIGVNNFVGGAYTLVYNPSGSTIIDRVEAIVVVVMDPVNTSLATSNNCAYVASAGASLPIELLSFGVEQREKNAFVKWETASESNTDFFLIERAIADGRFETVGKVEAFGNSTTKRSYFFEDKNLQNATYYYRIVSVDEDGEKQNSHLAVLRLINNFDFTVYESAENINISLVSDKTDEIFAEIIDLNGKLIYQFEETVSSGANQITRTFDLTSGIYFMKIKQNGVNKVQKFSYIR